MEPADLVSLSAFMSLIIKVIFNLAIFKLLFPRTDGSRRAVRGLVQQPNSVVNRAENASEQYCCSTSLYRYLRPPRSWRFRGIDNDFEFSIPVLFLFIFGILGIKMCLRNRASGATLLDFFRRLHPRLAVCLARGTFV